MAFILDLGDIFMMAMTIMITMMITMVMMILKEQEWHSGESTRLPPMWPGLESQIRPHMWVEFNGSLLSKTSLWFDICFLVPEIFLEPREFRKAVKTSLVAKRREEKKIWLP